MRSHPLLVAAASVILLFCLGLPAIGPAQFAAALDAPSATPVAARSLPLRLPILLADAEATTPLPGVPVLVPEATPAALPYLPILRRPLSLPGRTWTVDDDRMEQPSADFTSIPAAIAAAAPGDSVLVYSGTYPGLIVVDKRLTIAGTGSPVVNTASGRDYGFSLTADNTVIQGFSFPGPGGGDRSRADIEITSNGNSILFNTSVHSGFAVRVSGHASQNLIAHNNVDSARIFIDTEAHDNTIAENTMANNFSGHTIELDGSHNIVTANRLTGSLCAILEVGSGNAISRNTLSGCGDEGIRVFGQAASVLRNTISSAVHDDPYTDPTVGNAWSGIELGAGASALVAGNWVHGYQHGIFAYPGPFTLRANTLEGNRYGLSLGGQLGVGLPQGLADLDIDTSNTIDGKLVYVLHDLANVVLDPDTLPNAGFLACIHCQNITVRRFELSGNSHGILFSQVTGSRIENVLVDHNEQAGIALYDSSDDVVQDVLASANGEAGIYLEHSTRVTVDGSIAETNHSTGIFLRGSDYNTVSHNQVRDNGAKPPPDTPSGIGIWLAGSHNTVKSNHIVSNATYGIKAEGSGDLIYDNYLSNQTDAYQGTPAGTNAWSIPRTAGSNIFGGPYLGGNYWHDCAVTDSDGDYLGDVGVPCRSGGWDSYVADDAPLLPFDGTLPAEPLRIVSPQARDYISRSIPVAYTFFGPLQELTYALDGESPLPVAGPLTLERLTLGRHVLALQAHRQDGQHFAASVDFRVVPLGLGGPPAGTPGYPDEVAFSARALPVTYTLSYGVQNAGGGDVQVYLNKRLAGTPGPEVELMDDPAPGVLLDTIGATGDWVTRSLTVPVSSVAAGLENLVTFIHSGNAWSAGAPAAWQVRGARLRAEPVLGYPTIKVAAPRSVAPGADLPITLEIEQAAPSSEFSAYVYLKDPGGAAYYYPTWLTGTLALDPGFVQDGYHGRLPQPYVFAADAVTGTYTLVGELVSHGVTDTIVSVATQRVYFAHGPSLKLFLNRSVFGDGDEVILDSALTAGAAATSAPDAGRASAVFSLQDPGGAKTYLPDRTTTLATLDLAPLHDDYVNLLDDKVDATWPEGAYALDGTLYDRTGQVAADDRLTFDICRTPSGVAGDFRLSTALGPQTMHQCSLRLVEQGTLRYWGEQEIGLDRSSYEIAAPPGAYGISGVCTDGNGILWGVLPDRVEWQCGKTLRRDLWLERLTPSVAPAPAAPQVVAAPPTAGVAPLPAAAPLPTVASDPPGCSKNRVIVRFQLNEAGAEELAREWYKNDPLVEAERKATQVLARSIYITMTQSNPNVSFIDETAVGQELYTYQQLQSEREMTAADLTQVKDVTGGADYVFWVHMYFIDSKWSVYSGVTDPGTGLRLSDAQQDAIGPDRSAVLAQVLSAQAGIGKIMDDHEIAGIGSPRDPVVTVTLSPPLVSVDQPETTITVNVKDCRDNPPKPKSSGVPYSVQFWRKDLKRGTIQEAGYTKPFRTPFEPVATDINGDAKITYRLRRGSEAGAETIDLVVPKKGGTERIAIQVPIAGTRLQFNSRKPVIGLNQETVFDLLLTNTTLEGETTPVAGATVLLMLNEPYSHLQRGQVLEPGERDAGGNASVVTGPDGRAQVRYRAGNTAGLVNIHAVYQAPGIETPIAQDGKVQVKRDDFIISVHWLECYQTDERGSDWYGTLVNHEKTLNQCYDFRSETVWERRSDRHDTTAGVSFVQDETVVEYQGETTDTSRLIQRAYSSLSGAHLVNRVGSESWGRFVLPLRPINLPLPLNGYYLTQHWIESPSGSGGWTANYSYSGWTHRPWPLSLAPCDLFMGEGISQCAPWPDNSFAEMARGANWLALNRTGQNTYESYQYRYFLNDAPELIHAVDT